jgi:hypothetical protein
MSDNAVALDAEEAADTAADAAPRTTVATTAPPAADAPPAEVDDDGGDPAAAADTAPIAPADEGERSSLTHDDYEVALPDGAQLSERGARLVDGLKRFAAQNSLAPEAVSGLVLWFDGALRAEMDLLAKADGQARKATIAALRDDWGETYDDNIAVADAMFRRFPKAVQKALKAARLPDGSKLAAMPELTRALLHIGSELDRLAHEGDTGRGEVVTAADLRQELADLGKLRETDIAAYWRKNGMDRAIEIRRLLATDSVPSASKQRADQQAELAELKRMRSTDPDVFEHGRWRGSRLTPEERLAQLQAAAAR